MHPSFNESYRRSPPWDIGRPQAEFVKLAGNGEIFGRVLDVGCGTGENAIYLSQFGTEVWGIDSASLAIEKAKLEAQERGATVRFIVGDAFRLDELGTKFDTVVDSGLFHIFSDEERPLFTRSLRSAMETHGTYFMLAFSTKSQQIGEDPGECLRKRFGKSSGMDGRSTMLRIVESRRTSIRKEAKGYFLP